MTTNEQAEERRALAQLIATALDSSVEETPVAVQVGSTPTDVDYEIADIVLDSEWLAGERHRVAEAIIELLQATARESADRQREHDLAEGLPLIGTSTANEVEWHQMGNWARSVILAAFPAVGGSTPAVDGEAISNPDRVSVGGSGGTSNVDGEEGDGLPERDATPDEAFELGRIRGYDEAVSDNLPLDPYPYTRKKMMGRKMRTFRSARGPGVFDPRPGFSRDESRYQEGAGA